MRTIDSSFIGLLAALPAVLAMGSLRGEANIPPSVVDMFRWKNPFGEDLSPPDGFEAACEATKTFSARQHTLRDHMAPPPHGFGPWAEGMKPQFGGRPFPGHWDGLDEHGTLRKILIMEYADVPEAVKDWLETEAGREKGFFGVYDKPAEGESIVQGPASPRTSKADKGDKQVMIFAAGAVYETLPLWVAKGSKCEGERDPPAGSPGADGENAAALSDLKKYVIEPEDDHVVAWPVGHTKPDTFRDKRDVEFTIRAQLLKKAPKKATKTATSKKEGEGAATKDAGTKTIKDEL